MQSGAEGGANIFSFNYFGQNAYLAQSPQFYKQMMVGVFERVFEIAPVFRAEKHDTSRHLNEYTSVDFEMGYISRFEEIMEMEAAVLKYTLSYLSAHYKKEAALLNLRLPVIDTIPAVRFRDAKIKISETYNHPVKDWEDFEPEEEKLLCDLIYKETENFDLLFRGLEITTGGQRIHSYDEQVEKMNKRKMNVQLFESYLMMHKYGMPPHGGLGLGLERFTSKLLGYENVRFTTLFPRDIHRLVP